MKFCSFDFEITVSNLYASRLQYRDPYVCQDVAEVHAQWQKAEFAAPAHHLLLASRRYMISLFEQPMSSYLYTYQSLLLVNTSREILSSAPLPPRVLPQHGPIPRSPSRASQPYLRICSCQWHHLQPAQGGRENTRCALSAVCVEAAPQ